MVKWTQSQAILLNCHTLANYRGELTQVLAFVWLINWRFEQLANKLPWKGGQYLTAPLELIRQSFTTYRIWQLVFSHNWPAHKLTRESHWAWQNLKNFVLCTIMMWLLTNYNKTSFNKFVFNLYFEINKILKKFYSNKSSWYNHKLPCLLLRPTCYNGLQTYKCWQLSKKN